MERLLSRRFSVLWQAPGVRGESSLSCVGRLGTSAKYNWAGTQLRCGASSWAVSRIRRVFWNPLETAKRPNSHHPH